MKILHEILLEIPGMDPQVRYKLPFYYRHRWVAYLNPCDKGIELVFINGRKLSSLGTYLDDRGRKLVAGRIFYTEESVSRTEVLEVIYEALIYDIPKKKPKI